jgi:hypothetical protein
MDEKHASQICHYNSKSGGFGTRHFFSGGFCRKVADSETATFLVADFIPVQYVLGTTYNGHIPSGWSSQPWGAVGTPKTHGSSTKWDVQ